MSTLKVNKIRDTAGSADSITLDPNGGAVIAGVTTVSTIKVGSGVTISSDGDVFHTGVCTATSFAGEIPAASIVGVCTSGLTKTGGFGKILQVVKDQKTDAASSTTINAFTDIISNCVTITPTATGNKIFGTFSFSFGSSVIDHLINFRIVRDSTVVSDVGDTTSGFAYFATTQGMRCLFDANGGNFLTLTFLDTSVNTNAHTYKLQYFRSQAGTTYINRTGMIVGGTDYTSTYGGIGASTFTVMEIAA